MSTPQWTPPTQAQLRAADRYVDIVIKALKTEKGVHSETAIAAAARMAGTFLFRSFAFPLKDIKPGSAVLSDAANDHGPLLVQTLGSGLNTLKVQLDSTRLSGSVTTANQPHISVNETQSPVESQFRGVSAALKLTPEQSAHACALAAARLIQMSNGALDPHIGFSIAAYGFVEGSKTAPIALTETQAERKPWYKLWK
jgi:hypothetical protein